MLPYAPPLAQVAVEYSKVHEGNPLPRVLLIAVGAVDRGACIAPLSQYPDEMEYLYVPCSFVEQYGPRTVEATPAGVVEVIPVRLPAARACACVRAWAWCSRWCSWWVLSASCVCVCVEGGVARVRVGAHEPWR
jgi:hypothetical protein